VEEVKKERKKRKKGKMGGRERVREGGKDRKGE